MHKSKRRQYMNDEEVIQAGQNAFDAVKETWVDQNNPTPEEDVAAKNARLAAMIAAADQKMAES